MSGKKRRPKVKPNPQAVEMAIDRHADLRDFGKKEEAAKAGRELETKFPGNVDVYMHLGCCAEDDNINEEANLYFEKALKADPSDIDAQRAVGLVCLEKGDLQRAARLLAFMTSKGACCEPEVLLCLGSAFGAQGEHREAYRYYRIVVNNFPEMARTDRLLRKTVRKMEKHAGHTESILPAQDSRNAKLWLIVVVTAAILALFLGN